MEMKWVGRFVCLAGAAGALLALIFPPLATPEEKLLFIRMMHFLLIVAVVSPLLVLAGIFESADGFSRLRSLVNPLTAWVIFVASFALWHWPPALRLVAGSPANRLVEYAFTLAAGCLFWTNVFSTDPLNRTNNGGRIFYLVTAAAATDLPSVLMTLVPSMTRTWSMPELLMWLPANFVFMAVAVWLLAQWACEGIVVPFERADLSRDLVQHGPDSERPPAQSPALRTNDHGHALRRPLKIRRVRHRLQTMSRHGRERHAAAFMIPTIE